MADDKKTKNNYAKWPMSLGLDIFSRLIIPALLIFMVLYQVVSLSGLRNNLTADPKLSGVAQFYEGSTYERLADTSSKPKCPGLDCPLNTANFNFGAGDGWDLQGKSIHQRASTKYWDRIYYFAAPMKLPSFAVKPGSPIVFQVREIRGNPWRFFVNGVEKANSNDYGSDKLIRFLSDGGREGDVFLVGFEIDAGHNFDPGIGLSYNLIVSVPEVAQLLKNYVSATVALDVVPAVTGRFVVVMVAALGCFFIPFHRATLFYAIGAGLWSYLNLYRNGIAQNFIDSGVDSITERAMIFSLFYGSMFAFFSAFLRRSRKEAVFLFGFFCIIALAAYTAGKTGYGRALVPFIMGHHYLILSAASFLGCVIALRATFFIKNRPNARLRVAALLVSSAVFACCGLAEILLQGWVWGLTWIPLVDSVDSRAFLRKLCEEAMTFFGVMLAIEWAVMSKDREKVLKRFGMVVDHRTLAQLLKTKEIPTVMIDKLVVLFVDLREFTKLCTKLSPQDVTTALNEYLDVVTTAVKRNNGSVDKFVGDEVMALWGMDQGASSDPLDAVRTAIDIRQGMNLLNHKRLARGDDALQCGIGIHVGPAIVGPVGNSERIDFTAIGPTVNLAARLQSLTKTKRFDILISMDLVENVVDRILVQDLGLNHVRGFDKEIYVFGLLGVLEGDGVMRFEDPVLEDKLTGRGPGICQDAPENLLQAS